MVVLENEEQREMLLTIIDKAPSFTQNESLKALQSNAVALSNLYDAVKNAEIHIETPEKDIPD